MRGAEAILWHAFLTVLVCSCGCSTAGSSAPAPPPAGNGGAAGANLGIPGGAGQSGGRNASEAAGPFRILVLSTTLEFAHDSIATGQAMLSELGSTPDSELPVGAAHGSQFTVTIAKDDLSDFTEANLGRYAMLFWMNPTGPVFSSNATMGPTAKQAVEKFMQNGGAWGGVHSGTDFEKTGQWIWFQDQVNGAFFVSHDIDGTLGTVVTEAAGKLHPIMRAVPETWNTQDEWYRVNRDPGAVPGFTVLAKLAKDNRPVVWVREFPTGGGRSFYTIRGHNRSVYAESAFRRLILNGILWATHRMR